MLRVAFFLLVGAADLPTSPGSAGETVVVGAADEQDDDRRVLRGKAQTSSPEEALDAFPEVTLLRSGGPLSPTRLEVRGLSGPRLSASIGGLQLGAPSSGAIDVGLLPWSTLAAVDLRAGASSGSLGGALAFEPLDASWPRAAAKVGGGTLETLDAGVVAAGPVGPGRFLVGGSAARTGGGFWFKPTSPTGAVRAPTRRVNNDQTRASALVNVSTRALGLNVDVLGLVAGREGGIPGFAAAPTDELRGRHAIVGGRLKLTQPLTLAGSTLTLSASTSGRLDHRATRPAAGRQWSPLTSTSTEASVSLTASELPWGMQGAAHLGVERAGFLIHPFRRRGARGGGSWGASPVRWWGVRLKADGALLGDVGPLWGGMAETWLGPPWVRVSARVARANRAPTLEELYAPTGLVVGNPELRPESATEVELVGRLKLSKALRLRATVYGGRVDEAIVLLNRNAFEIAAANTGGLWRAGAEAELSLLPHPLIRLEGASRLLLTRLDVTGAPLPVAPPLTGRIGLTFGRRSTIHAQMLVRYRSDSTGTLFGTVTVPGYALADLVARWPVSPHVRLTATLSNFFNDLTARDLNGLPLPGRQLYASLEASL